MFYWQCYYSAFQKTILPLWFLTSFVFIMSHFVLGLTLHAVYLCFKFRHLTKHIPALHNVDWLFYTSVSPFATTWRYQKHSVHLPSFCRVVEPPTKFSKRRGLDRTSTFRGGLLEKRGWLFQGGGLQFSHKK